MTAENLQIAIMLKCAGFRKEKILELLKSPAPMCTEALIKQGVSITKAQ